MKTLRAASDIAWRVLVVAAAVFLVVYLLVRLKIVVLPLGIALLFATFLAPCVAWLERRGLKRTLATAAVFIGFLVALGTVGVLIAPPVAHQFDELGDTVDQGVNDIEDWLVDGPLGLTDEQIADYRSQFAEYARRALRSSGDQIIAGAVIVGEFLTGALLTLLATLFIVKDGPRMQRWFLDKVPAPNREVVAACGGRAWGALTGFLRGAAILGFVEAIIMSTALAIVGSDLVIPVAVLTFLAAFFPVLGAVLAGIVATLVALVSGGVADAAVIGIVAILVQQFDNELLAPVIYGRELKLHPLVVVSALTAGGSLGGIVGAFIAVPVTAVVVAVSAELWSRRAEA